MDFEAHRIKNTKITNYKVQQNLLQYKFQEYFNHLVTELQGICATLICQDRDVDVTVDENDNANVAVSEEPAPMST